jgi:hypothetical protein
MTAATRGARFEIKVDDVVRTHRDMRETTIEAARFLQQRYPGASIVTTDLRDGSTVSFERRRHRREAARRPLTFF